MQFTLTIELGNEAMQCPADVGHALEFRVVPWLIGAGNVPFTGGETGRIIRDVNGNTVGKWEVRDTSSAYEVALWKSAIGFMSQYNGRTVAECLDLARKELEIP